MTARRKGFTLIELMVVIAVIAILATIALFGIGRAQAAARDTSRQQVMNGVRTALERYYADSQAYPNSADFCSMITALTAGTSPYLGSAPTDPKTKAAICGAGNPTAGGATYYYENQGSGVGSTCTGAAIPAGYQLRLAKEGGGYSFFCSPQ